MEATNGQMGIGIDGVPTPQEFDPDLEGWVPGLPQEKIDATAILYTALSQFMFGLDQIFAGTVLGITFDGDTVVAVFPDGKIWGFQADRLKTVGFQTTEVVPQEQAQGVQE
jgi:hypothetical protein